jgi:hypothetical protein
VANTEFFSPPDGAFVANPNAEWLEDLILNVGEDYWNAGAGQASLKREDDGSNVELLLTLVPMRGFYLEYIDSNNNYFVSLGDGTFDETATVYVGGDPVVLPTALLVAKELAAAAVEEFCRTGERSSAVRWKLRRDLNWHYGSME